MNSLDRSFVELCRASKTNRASRPRARCVDAWTQTLFLLEELSAFSENGAGRAGLRHLQSGNSHHSDERNSRDHFGNEPEHTRRSRTFAASADPHADITILERLSPSAIVLRWCSCYCHYGEQLWIRRTARGTGICAMTGGRIRRGDSVFRPRYRVPNLPANFAEMIYASAIE
jgi:hypothetical protein